jgi:hypothetical protein
MRTRRQQWGGHGEVPRARRGTTTYAQQGFAGDGEQRPLVPRSRCSPRLKPSVDMTSDVKGCSKFFMSSSQVPISSCRPSAEAEPVRYDG